MVDTTGPTGANGLPIGQTPSEPTPTSPPSGVAPVETEAKQDALAVLTAVRPILSGAKADLSHAVAAVASLAPSHLSLAESLAALPDEIRASVHGVAALPAEIRAGAKQIASLEEKGRKAVLAFLAAEFG